MHVENVTQKWKNKMKMEKLIRNIVNINEAQLACLFQILWARLLHRIHRNLMRTAKNKDRKIPKLFQNFKNSEEFFL